MLRIGPLQRWLCGRGPRLLAAWLACSLLVAGGCSPEPFAPPLGQSERVILEVNAVDATPIEELPLAVNGPSGEMAGTIDAGKSRKGWTLFYRTPDGQESLLWGVDRVGELFLISQTTNGLYVRLYWYTPGLLGVNAMVTQVDTRDGETETRKAREQDWIDAVKILRASKKRSEG